MKCEYEKEAISNNTSYLHSRNLIIAWLKYMVSMTLLLRTTWHLHPMFSFIRVTQTHRLDLDETRGPCRVKSTKLIHR